jgi:hypothetical protein
VRQSGEHEQDLLSVDEAAAELGWTRRTVWKYVGLQNVPTFRVPGDRRTMIRRADLAKLRAPIPIDPAKKEAA